MVFMPYIFDEACREQPIAQRISTGLACHSSFERAAISAICEVIERDTFTITWQGQLAPSQIRLGSLSEDNQDLAGRFQRSGYLVTVFDITLDVGVPSILSVLRGTTSERPALVFAASTNLDPEKAVRKSLEELAHTARMCCQLKNERPNFDPVSWDNIRTQEDHVRLYGDHDKASLAGFLFSSKNSMDFDEIECLATGDAEYDLTMLVQKVQALWHRVLVADLTTSDVRNLGLRVVRAVIPGFHPLFVGHLNRALGGSRLWNVPQKLGHPGVTRESGDNPVPHPYP
jgi:ribosomal protein S12 methylthiotransferase accessory factor